jgi:NADH-quinone oxidoreductase subunit H
MSALTTILFLGGWLAPINIPIFKDIPYILWFLIKMTIILFIFLWSRAAFPRYRFDQLMSLTWRKFLPITIGGILFLSLTIYTFSGPEEIIKVILDQS